jgi:hypothetical protein
MAAMSSLVAGVLSTGAKLKRVSSAAGAIGCQPVAYVPEAGAEFSPGVCNRLDRLSPGGNGAHLE